MAPHAGVMGARVSGPTGSLDRLRVLHQGRRTGKEPVPPPPPPMSASSGVAKSESRNELPRRLSEEPEPASVSASVFTTPRKATSLGELTGLARKKLADSDFPFAWDELRSRNESGDEGSARRDHPRLAFAPRHAFIAILLLSAALCASLTMLVQQSTRIEELQQAAGAQAAVGAQSDDDATDASPQPTDASSSSTSEMPSEGADTSVESSATSSASAQTSDPQGQHSSAPSEPALLDLNTADLEALDAIKGIGPVTAQRILDHRAAIGRFASVDQLLDVKGIGPKTLETLRTQVTVR